MEDDSADDELEELAAAAAGGNGDEGGGGEGEDEDGGGEEDEFVHVNANYYYLEYIIRFLGMVHAVISLCMLIAYYNLKIPLAIFKREKEVARRSGMRNNDLPRFSCIYTQIGLMNYDLLHLPDLSSTVCTSPSSLPTTTSRRCGTSSSSRPGPSPSTTGTSSSRSACARSTGMNN